GFQRQNPETARMEPERAGIDRRSRTDALSRWRDGSRLCLTPCLSSKEASYFETTRNVRSEKRSKEMIPQTNLGGSFTFANTKMTVNRMGYGAMQLAGPGVWGPPRDPEEAVKVLREAIDAGVNHVDTSDYYGPHVTNQIIKRALHPYADGLVIVT